MAQFLRPDSNVTQTSFTNGFANIDESAASDADFAYGANNTAAVLEVGLSNPSGTPASGTTTVRYRVAKTNAGVVDGAGATVTVTCAVYQGTTLIAADSARTATGTWTAYSFTPNMASVTDWSDVRLRFTTSASGGTTANRRGGAVSWAELEAPDAQSGITGSLSATESGADTASFSGGVVATGTLSASESGSDTASFTGTVTDAGVTGSLSATESGSDSASLSGSVAVSGSLSATSTGSDTATISGGVSASGSLNSSETGSDTATFSGMAILQGLLNATETGSDTASASGSVSVGGSLTATETGQDTFSGSGSLEGDGATGSLSATETGEDSAGFSGLVLVLGELDGQDAADDFNGVGYSGVTTCRRTSIPPHRSGTIGGTRPRQVSRGTR